MPFSPTGPALRALGLVALAGACSGLSAQTRISEFEPNPPGSDPANVSFELSGTPGEAFSGWVLSIESDFGSGAGTVDRAAAVSGTFDANGLLTVTIPDLENPSFTVVVVDAFTGSAGSTDIDGDNDGTVDDVSTFGTILDAIGVPDTNGEPLYGAQLGGADFAYVGSEPLLVFRGASVGDWYAVGSDTLVYDINAASVPAGNFDADPTATTFYAVNPSETGAGGDFDERYVHEIQGSTNLADGTLVGTAGAADESPLLGDAVRVQGIVTQLLPDLGGFYLQEEDIDADVDAYSSEGIFVSSATAVGVGNLVSVEGTVAEVEGETRINASGTTVDDAGDNSAAITPVVVTLPTPTVLMDADGDYVANLEQFEGMLVAIDETLSVTELFQLDRFGTIRVSAGGRLEQFTQANAPDAAGFTQHLKDIAARSLVFDDGSDVQNPNPILVPDLGADGTLNGGDVFRMGDTYAATIGVLSYSEDDQSSSEEPEYRIHLPGTTLTAANPSPTMPADVGGSLKVASLNVLNFFTTLDEYPSVGEGSGPSALAPRGADANPQAASPTPGATDEYERQLAKLVEAIVAIDADVFGLVELENDFAPGGASPTGTGTVIGSGVAIQELVDAVNAEIGAPAYEWVSPVSGEFVGGDAIAVGIIYKPATVMPLGASAVLDTPAFLDPNGSGSNRNRASIAQTFEELASGETFTAVVNHFKSKGDSGLAAACEIDPSSDPDCDQLDGQGFWNGTRTAAARELLDWLAGNPTGSGDLDILILGDLNAYAEEDPVQAVIDGADDVRGTADDFTDLASAMIGASAYSYVFDGQTGTLDYALASTELTAKVTGVTEWHINSDEPDAFDYNLEFGRDPTLFTTDPFRASDHDPVIVGLNLASSTIEGDLDGNGTLDRGDYLIVRASLGSSDPAADLDGDGRVTTRDLRYWFNLYRN